MINVEQIKYRVEECNWTSNLCVSAGLGSRKFIQDTIYILNEIKLELEILEATECALKVLRNSNLDSRFSNQILNPLKVKVHQHKERINKLQDKFIV